MYTVKGVTFKCAFRSRQKKYNATNIQKTAKMNNQRGRTMAHFARIDERAFNRGVDQVLRFKPITNAVRNVFTGTRKVEGTVHATDSNKNRKTVVVTVSKRHSDAS